MVFTATVVAALYWYLNQPQQPPEFSQSKTREEELTECPADPELDEALLNLDNNRKFIKYKNIYNEEESCFYHDVAKQIQRYCAMGTNKSSEGIRFLFPEQIKYLYKNGNEQVKSILDIFTNKAQRLYGYENFYDDVNSGKQSKEHTKLESTTPESLETLTSDFFKQLTQKGKNSAKEFRRWALIYHPDHCTLTKEECSKYMKALNLAREKLKSKD